MKQYVTQRDNYGFDLKWQVGDIEIYRIIEAQWIIPLQWWAEMHKDYDYSPEAIEKLEWMVPHYAAHKDGQFMLTCCVQSFLVKYNGKNLLIDTGGLYGYDEGEYFDNLLKVGGCTPEDIDYVMFTHLHGDHFARNVKMGVWGYPEATFPNAKYLFERTGFDFLMDMQIDARKRRNSTAYDLIWPFKLECLTLIEQGRADIIDMDYVWEGVVRMTPQEGHEPGNVGFWFESKGETMLICGDTFHSPYMLTQLGATPQWEHNVEVSIATRKALLEELIEKEVFFLCAHFGKGGYVKKLDNGEYIMVPANDEGITFQQALDAKAAIEATASAYPDQQEKN